MAATAGRRKAIVGVPLAGLIALVGPSPSQASGDGFTLVSTIAFSSNRDHVNDDPPLTPPLMGAEVYLWVNPDLVSPDPSNALRLTSNTSFDGFANLSPDGKKIAFDSTRLTGTLNTSDLFLMNTDGTEQTLLTRGSAATWSPDSKSIAFHASASGAGVPTRPDPGSATSDSDIFIVNVDDLLAGADQPMNITNSQNIIDEDADWSPDGERIVYTRHADTDNPIQSNTAEVYVLSLETLETEPPQRLTFNNEEERAPSWNPDGDRIAFMCRIGAEINFRIDFEICVMNADGSDLMQLTDNAVLDATPSWSPDGQHLVFHRPVAGQFQLFMIKPTLNPDGTRPTATPLTFPPGANAFPNWGELRVKVGG